MFRDYYQSHEPVSIITCIVCGGVPKLASESHSPQPASNEELTEPGYFIFIRSALLLQNYEGGERVKIH